jgi:hypothetical protein
MIQGITFGQAINAVRNGKIALRESNPNRKVYYMKLENGFSFYAVQITSERLGTISSTTYKYTQDDYQATDWIIQNQN